MKKQTKKNENRKQYAQPMRNLSTKLSANIAHANQKAKSAAG